jgi:hypothetical protein
MEKKGYYIKKERKGEILLNIFAPDFIAYLDQLDKVNDWVRFRIYEREKPAANGLTHNMEAIQVSKTDKI